MSDIISIKKQDASPYRTSTDLARRRRWNRNLPLLIMFAPIVLYFLVFKYGPMGGLVISFKHYNFIDGVWGSPWAGFTYFRLIFSNPRSLDIIRNTFVLSLMLVFIGFPFPIILAIMINEARNMAFKRSVQTLVYMPHFLSWVIVGSIIITIFNQSTGFANYVYGSVMGRPYPFLLQPGTWRTIFVSSGIWKSMGWSAIIYLAALATIDPELYDSAKIDGAGKWRQIRHITIPGITSIMALLFILSMGNVMEIGFDHVYVLQNQAVSNVSEVITTYVYKVGLLGGQFSLTAAMGFFQSGIGLILVFTANLIARRWGRALW